MTEQLSLWALVVGATLPVQMVMLILFGASVVSWVMIVQRGLFIRQTRNDLSAFEDTFWSGVDLNELFREGNARIKKDNAIDGVESLFRAGFREFNRLSQSGSTEPEVVIEGVERAMRVALSREEEKLNTHLPFLASVASVSPYIGLFGTVWGIMHSFRGLANVQQATLATVAPGISEALIATAMGLFAAIPAVLAYNRYSANADVLYNSYETFADEFSSILHRRLHSN
ncbi:MAG: protein TolQ [Gammaproteobacteria bacterium]|nr:MAG: protein TolQ [Gammaproteobacteria bacterium]RLA54056.1 MAG: protein TolQ [Gammaproteobacteria bacterium]